MTFTLPGKHTLIRVNESVKHASTRDRTIHPESETERNENTETKTSNVVSVSPSHFNARD